MGKSENSFSFKSFNQLILNVEVKTRSALRLHEDSYFRQSLLKLYDLDLSEIFIDLFHEIEPKTRSVNLLVLNYSSIVSLLLEKMDGKNLSLLELLSALWMDFGLESLDHASDFLSSTLPFLSFRDPEIINKLFRSYVVLVKNFMSERQHLKCFKLFSFLLLNDRDYIRHFGCQLLALLLRQSEADLFFQMIKHGLSLSDKSKTFDQTVALLIFHSMMNVSESYYSNTVSRLIAILLDPMFSNDMCLSLGYLLCKFGNLHTSTVLANSIIDDSSVFQSENLFYLLNCFVRLKSPEFHSIVLLKGMRLQSTNSKITNSLGFKKILVELLLDEDVLKSNFNLIKSIFISSNINDMLFIISKVIPISSNLFQTRLLFDFLKHVQSHDSFDFYLFSDLISIMCKLMDLSKFNNSIITNSKFNLPISLFKKLFQEFLSSRESTLLFAACQFKVDSELLIDLLNASVDQFNPSLLPTIYQIMQHVMPTNIPLLCSHLKPLSNNVEALNILYLLHNNNTADIIDNFNILGNLSNPDQNVRIASLKILSNSNIYSLLLQCELITDLLQHQRNKCNLINSIATTHSNDPIIISWLLAQFYIPFKPVWEFIINLKLSNKVIAQQWLIQLHLNLNRIKSDENETEVKATGPGVGATHVANFWKNVKLIFPNIHFYSPPCVINTTRTTITTDVISNLLKFAVSGHIDRFTPQSDLLSLWHHPCLNLLYSSEVINIQFTSLLVRLISKYKSFVLDDLFTLLSNSNEMIQSTAFDVISSNSASLSKEAKSLIKSLINSHTFKDALVSMSFSNDQNISTDPEYRKSMLKHVIPIVHGKLLLKVKSNRACISTFLSLLSNDEMVMFLNLCFLNNTTIKKTRGMINTIHYLLTELPYCCKPFATMFMEVIQRFVDTFMKDTSGVIATSADTSLIATRTKVFNILYILADITGESKYLSYLFQLLPARIDSIPLESISSPSLFLKAFKLVLDYNHHEFMPLLSFDMLYSLIDSKYCQSTMVIGLKLIHWLKNSIPVDTAVHVPSLIRSLPINVVCDPCVSPLLIDLIPNNEFELLADFILKSKDPKVLVDHVSKFNICVSHINLAIPLLNKSNSLQYRSTILSLFVPLFNSSIQSFINQCYTRHSSDVDAIDMDHRFNGLKDFRVYKSDLADTSDLAADADASPIILFVLLDCLDCDESNIVDISLQLLSFYLGVDDDYLHSKLIEYLKRGSNLLNNDLMQFILSNNTSDFKQLQIVNNHNHCLTNIFAIQKQDKRASVGLLVDFLALTGSADIASMDADASQLGAILLKWIYPLLLPNLDDELYSRACSLILSNSPAKSISNILRYQFIKQRIINLNEYSLLKMYMNSIRSDSDHHLYILQQLIHHKSWYSKDPAVVVGILKTAKIICPLYNNAMLSTILFKSIHLLRYPRHVRELVIQLLSIIITKMPNYLGYTNELLKDALCTGLWHHVYRYTLHSILIKLDIKIGEIDYLIDSIYDACLMEIHQQYVEKNVDDLKKSLPEIQSTTYIQLSTIIGTCCSVNKLPQLLSSINIPPLLSKKQSTKYTLFMHHLFEGLFTNSYCRSYLVSNFKQFMVLNINNKNTVIINAMLNITKKCLTNNLDINTTDLIDVLGSCLDLNDAVIINTLKCVNINVKLFSDCMPLIIDRVMELLSRNIHNELQIACLKTLSLILPFAAVRMDKQELIIHSIMEYMTDVHVHYIACSVFKQLTIKASHCKNNSSVLLSMYKALDLIMEYSIQSNLPQIRTSMQHLVYHCVSNMPFTVKKLAGMVDFYLVNLDYSSKGGVLASISMLELLVNKLPITNKMLIKLSLKLGNTKDSDIVQAIKKCLDMIFSKSPSNIKSEYGGYILKWYNKHQLLELSISCLECSSILQYCTSIHDFSDLFGKNTDVVQVGIKLMQYNIKFNNLVEYTINSIESRLNLNYADLYKILIVGLNDHVTPTSSESKRLGISLLYRYQIGTEQEYNMIIKIMQSQCRGWDSDFIEFIHGKVVHAAYKGAEYKRKTMIQFTCYLTNKKLLSLNSWFKIVIKCQDDDQISKQEGLMEQIRLAQEELKSRYLDYYDEYANTKKQILLTRISRKQQQQQLSIQEPEIAAQVRIKKNQKKVLKRRLKDSQHKAKRLKLQ
eukprot:NODE_5_length_49639_cov_0.484336.p1 type:complete len:2128 gc:universal NODE_5_length_49639_cov_0.484336:24931-18548(-)